MPTLFQNLALIRQRLLQPDKDDPADHILLNIMLEKIADHCLQLNNTQNHWSVSNTQLTVSAGDEDVPVGAADFGRPFLVYTTDPTDPYHWRREIPFTLMQNADWNYLGPQQSQSQEPSAVQMAFYRTPASDPQWMARVSPIAGASATYELWYEANYDTINPSLGDAPGLGPFHHLIRCETALDALPSCAWGKLSIHEDRAGWELRCGSLATVLTNAIGKYQKQFDNYKAQSTRGGVNRKRRAGADYMGEDCDSNGFSSITWR